MIIVTKNHLVTRDIDLLKKLAIWRAVIVNVSVTTLDASLQRVMEPRASTPARRIRAVSELISNGIPVRVLVAPVIPGLTDHEIPAILERAASAGALDASYILLRLPHGVKELFASWLQRHFPERARRVLNRVREVRSGKLNNPRFATRMGGEGVYAEQIQGLTDLSEAKTWHRGTHDTSLVLPFMNTVTDSLTPCSPWGKSHGLLETSETPGGEPT